MPYMEADQDLVTIIISIIIIIAMYSYYMLLCIFLGMHIYLGTDMLLTKKGDGYIITIFCVNTHLLTNYNFGYHPGTRVLTHIHMVNVRKHGDFNSGNST